MAASKELLTDILDGCSVVQNFLVTDLKQAPLSQACRAKRDIVSKTLQEIINKIRHAHPSIRPRVNTPGTGKKPALPPPMDTPAPPLPLEEEPEEELYEDPMQDMAPPPPAEDYLSFEPTHAGENGVGEEEPQEMYEAMVTMDQELYEEPAMNVAAVSLEEEAAENYEDPVTSRPSTASLPSASQENSGSGSEYAVAGLHLRDAMESTMEVSTDWSSVYTMPGKDRLKVSALKNIAIKGYLDKLGGRNHKTWQRRYCVLAGPLMYFYEKESSKTYNNCIAVLSFMASAADNMTNDKKNYFAFKLTQADSNTGKSKDYYFRASSRDVQTKWLKSFAKVCNGPLGPSPSGPSPVPQSNRNSAATLPRMPSRTSVSTFLPPAEDSSRMRAQSLGEGEGEGEGQELYEDMAIPEREEEGDEYVAVSPTHELESSEEYVDVVPQTFDQEEYEDTANFQQPPPPLSPPPGPPTEFFPPSKFSSQPTQPTHTAPPKAPAPLPQAVDTTRIYSQPSGIRLELVFVSLWDFSAGASDELALHRGDLVYVSDPLDSEDWWFGEMLDTQASKKVGPAGFFPKSYSTVAFETVTS